VQPDLLHIHSRRGADTFGGVAARLAGVPAVLSRRVDSVDAPFFGRLKYAPYRCIVAISACIRDQLAALGVPAAKLRLVPSAVAAPAVGNRAPLQAFVREFGLPPDAFPIAVIAQLIPRKGQRFFFEAVARLRDAHPQIRAILFGTGPLRAALAAQVTTLGLDALVQFAGHRPDLDRFLGHFRLVVHPALREGLGIGVLEAQAAGVPVVAFRAGGLVEAVADGRTGLLVAPGDTPALAAAIGRLIDDEEQRAHLATAGPAWVCREFGVAAMVDGNLAVYCHSLGQRPGGNPGR